MVEITLPELGEGIETATVAELHCQLGDRVAKDSDLLEVVTDKATFHVPTEVKGEIIEIRVKVGDKPKVGDCLCVIKEEV